MKNFYRPRIITQSIIKILFTAFLFSLVFNLLFQKDLKIFEKFEVKIDSPSNSDNNTHFVRDIKIDDAIKLIEQGNLILIDARSPKEFSEKHINNAVNISVENFDDYLDLVFSIPKDTTILIYCESITCNLSHKLSEKLKTFGFTKIYVMVEGINGWIEKKLPVVKDEE